MLNTPSRLSLEGGMGTPSSRAALLGVAPQAPPSPLRKGSLGPSAVGVGPLSVGASGASLLPGGVSGGSNHTRPLGAPSRFLALARESNCESSIAGSLESICTISDGERSVSSSVANSPAIHPRAAIATEALPGRASLPPLDDDAPPAALCEHYARQVLTALVELQEDPYPALRRRASGLLHWQRGEALRPQGQATPLPRSESEIGRAHV